MHMGSPRQTHGVSGTLWTIEEYNELNVTFKPWRGNWSSYEGQSEMETETTSNAQWTHRHTFNVIWGAERPHNLV